MTNPYRYIAKYVDNYDGDTIDFDIELIREVDFGFKLRKTINAGTYRVRVRLLDIDTEELRGRDRTPEQKKKAEEAKHFVREQLSQSSEIYVTTKKTGKYGRYLADVEYSSGGNILQNLAARLKQEGLEK